MITLTPPAKRSRQTGFTLVEMAMVLLIIALLLGGLLPTISSQIEQQRMNETRKTLEEIKDALFGFAAANGRLPCPASISTNGMESFCNASGVCATEILPPPAFPPHGNCFKPYDGFLPAATLGITPTDSQGYALDGWSNRIRYAVTKANSNAFTTPPNGMQATGMGTLDPDLHVCAGASTSASFINGTNCGGGTAVSLTTKGVAVIYSLGKNAKTVGTDADEAANLNSNKVFVSHVPSPATSPNGEFDDIVTWLSANILYNRMVAAGKLP